MLRLLAILLALAAAPAAKLGDAARVGAPGDAARAGAPPAADAPLPRSAGGLAAALTETTRALRAAGWDGRGAVPADVTLLALHHQRILRRMAERRSLGDATLAKLPRDVLGEARDTVLARRALAAIPRGKAPRVRTAEAAPASELRAAYAEGQRRFRVHWSVLAAVNLVESAFGRVRSASEAGARGPMQFLPATWRAYGMGGDIDDPRDAILGAANYLHRSGAARDLDRALYAYNHSTDYVRAIKRFASRMRADERAYRTYYAWQVYVGGRRITGPGVE
jgi:membrane-bound lytic murein transglycosylase B